MKNTLFTAIKKVFPEAKEATQWQILIPNDPPIRVIYAEEYGYIALTYDLKAFKPTTILFFIKTLKIKVLKHVDKKGVIYLKNITKNQRKIVDAPLKVILDFFTPSSVKFIRSL